MSKPSFVKESNSRGREAVVAHVKCVLVGWRVCTRLAVPAVTEARNVRANAQLGDRVNCRSALHQGVVDVVDGYGLARGSISDVLRSFCAEESMGTRR
jgi:hypothetical protein